MDLKRKAENVPGDNGLVQKWLMMLLSVCGLGNLDDSLFV